MVKKVTDWKTLQRLKYSKLIQSNQKDKNVPNGWKKVRDENIPNLWKGKSSRFLFEFR